MSRVVLLGLTFLALVAPKGAGAASDAAPSDDALIPELEFFVLPEGSQALALAHGYVDPASFRLTVGGRLWEADHDFRLRSRAGLVVPLRHWAAPGAGPVVVKAAYRYLPVAFAPRLDLRPLAQAPVPATSGARATPEATATGPGSYGTLTVRGSKSVQVSSGNRRDLTVDQNLRLSIAGQLTRDISVRAALSDDNLPVVPEGNTTELRDIDKVLVELTAPHWRATLGDFVALRGGTVFGNYRRKLQGFSIAAEGVDVLAGSPRGRYRTVEIRGQEANQGPYYLGAGDSGTNLYIVAGSERVTLDGAELTRGADRDYVIDYVRGTVTFTYRRMITAESLIVVEYEEGEGPYARTVVGAGAGASARVPFLGGSLASLTVRLTREKDDPQRLRTGTLDAEDENVLAAAGDDPLAALASGVTSVDPGTGDYTAQEQGSDTIYVYTPGGDLTVAFAYVGAGFGDYDLQSLTEAGTRVYVYRGPGLGAYRVGRLLPLPESHSLVTIAGALGDTSGAGVDVEWDISKLDRNVLSTSDSGDDHGEAGRVRLRSGAVGLAGGTLAASASHTDRGGFFQPLLSDRTIFDYERWGLADRARRANFLAQRDKVTDVATHWAAGDAGRRLALGGTWAHLAHGPDLTARRWQASGDAELGRAQWRGTMRRATARDRVDPLEVTRRDQDHQVVWQGRAVVPRVSYRRQEWTDAAIAGPRAAGYRLREYGGALAGPAAGTWSWDLGFDHGLADSLRTGAWQGVRDSRTWHARAGTPRVGGVRLVGEGTVREVHLPGGGTETTRLAKADLAGLWPTLGSDWSLSYSVDNSRAEVLRREIVFVGTHQGSYDAVGDFVGFEQGDYNLVLAGTDSLVATTAVKADLAWRQDFSGLGHDRAWGAWTSVTRAAVEGRSRTDDVGSLLALNPRVLFDPDTVVLARVQLNQEFDFLRHLRDWDLRVLWDHDESRDRQYAASQEDRLLRRQHGTLSWNATRQVTLRLQGEREADRRTTDAVANEARQSYDAHTRHVDLEAVLRPRAGDRVAFGVEALTRDDSFSGVSQTEYAVNPSLRWRPRNDWTLQCDLRVAEVTSDEPAGARRPYFFPRPGRNVDASARLAWNPNDHLTFALAYFGRKQGDLEWQHELRLESSARF